MVGRDDELRALLDAFERAERAPGCELVTVVGVAGVGKSRLIRELSERLSGRAHFLEGRCLPYGEGITFWPVAEIVKQAAGIEDSDLQPQARDKIGAILSDLGQEEATLVQERVGAAVGLAEAEGAIQEVFWAIRRLLESVAAERAVVAVIDDIHWAEATLLDLIEYIAGFSRGHPLLLLCTARPELREGRPDWGRTGSIVALQALALGESEVLIRNLLGQARFPEEIRGRIVASAEGNPLFVEEMLRMLIDDGLLRREDGHWVPTGDLSQVSAPRTVQALIAARLDRLQDEERAVIQRASVVGQVFYWGAVADLSPEEARRTVGGNLQTLLRKELIVPEPSEFAGEDAFRFGHILVRDAAYESTPKRIRADLHERFASWLERAAGARASEYEEILGYHLEQAHRYLVELGPVGEHGLVVASRAATRLAAAGRLAFARGDMPAAANLFSRATTLFPDREPARVELLPELGAALIQTGAWREAEAVFTQAIEEGRALGDRRAEALALVRSLWLGLHAGRFSNNLDALPELERAIAMFEELGDDGGLAEAWTLRFSVELWCGRAALAVEISDRALDHARRANDRRQEAEALRWRSLAEATGPMPVSEAADRFDALMRGPAATGGLLRAAIAKARADVEAMRGNFDLARELLDVARASAKDFGLEMFYASGVLRSAGHVAMLAGEPATAERDLREAVERARNIGDLGHLASTASLLAEALYAQGDLEEGLSLTEEAEQLTLEGDIDAQVLWQRVRAKILARKGDIDEAVRLASEAADAARSTDYLESLGQALMDLAEVLQEAGRGREAVAVVREALDAFDRKGSAVMADAARRLLEMDGAAPPE